MTPRPMLFPPDGYDVPLMYLINGDRVRRVVELPPRMATWAAIEARIYPDVDDLDEETSRARQLVRQFADGVNLSILRLLEVST